MLPDRKEEEAGKEERQWEKGCVCRGKESGSRLKAQHSRKVKVKPCVRPHDLGKEGALIPDTHCLDPWDEYTQRVSEGRV